MVGKLPIPHKNCGLWIPAFAGMTVERISRKAVHARGGVSSIGLGARCVEWSNPATLQQGDDIRVQVLYQGKPVVAKLQATYDGFSTEEHGYTNRTQTGRDGIARFRLTSYGLWMARSKLKLKNEIEGFELTKYPPILFSRLA